MTSHATMLGMMTVRARWLVTMGVVMVVVVGWLVWDAWTTNPVGRWFDGAGNPIAYERMQVYAGSDHCDMASTKFMALAWPLDVMPPLQPTRMESYVWQPPDDFMRPEYLTPGVVETMPGDAENTGFHRGRLTLWVSESNLRKAVFVMNGDEIQQWAFVPGAGFCA
jgi:hypothetical protein